MLINDDKRADMLAVERSSNEVPLAELMPLIEEQLKSGQSVRFSPKGVSMLPMLRQGRDQVMLTALHGSPKKYDILLYRRGNGSFVLHRVVKTGDNYTCIGDNQFVCEKDIERDQIIAVVSSFRRDDREYSTTSLVYKVYCVLWHHSRFVRRLWRSLRFRLKNLCRKIFFKK